MKNQVRPPAKYPPPPLPNLVLAKPSGITLAEHTANVWKHAREILDNSPFLEQKYRALTGLDLRALLNEAVHWHDAGKKHELWQRAVQLDYLQYRNWRIVQGWPAEQPDRSQNAKDYAKYEKYCRQQNTSSAPNLLKAELRHEFASLAKAEKANLSLAVKAAIAAHHGKLGHLFKEKRWLKDAQGAFSDHWGYFWDESISLGHNLPRREKWEKAVMERYTVSAVRALLRLADTRASREESEGLLAPMKPFEYSFSKPSYRPVQEKALACAADPISILRAPTGSGKTDASMLWGRALINPDGGGLPKADRLVIAMPTRFTSNALAMNIADSVSDTGLYHSSAWYTRYGEIDDYQQRNFALEQHKLAQLLATPVTVCTIDHLLICLTGGKEDHHATFFFLANAAVVLDEADFYDPFVQSNIQILLTTLRFLKAPVLIMSATVPDSALQLYDIAKPIAEAENDTEPMRKLQVLGEISVDVPEEDPEATEPAELVLPSGFVNLIGEMLEKGQGILFANTVARGLAFYQYVTPLARKKGIPLTFYHSRFTEPDKKRIEEKLLNELGRKAWEDQSARGIAILTQIGEMSINISTPLMYSDLCPWDRLSQRLGRLNRFNESPEGVCSIGIPFKQDALYPAPYGTYDKSLQAWVASNAFDVTRDDLQACIRSEAPQLITSRELVNKVNALYPGPEELAGKAKANQDELVSRMKKNWLIVPDTNADEEAGRVGDWKSRDIAKQTVVFTQFPEYSDKAGNTDDFTFPNYDSFRSFQLETGISCPHYLVEKAFTLGQVVCRKYIISDNKDDPETVWIANAYDANLGLAGLGLNDKQISNTKPPANIVD